MTMFFKRQATAKGNPKTSSKNQRAPSIACAAVPQPQFVEPEEVAKQQVSPLRTAAALTHRGPEMVNDFGFWHEEG